MIQVGNKDGLLPTAASFSNAFFGHPRADKGKRIVHRNAGMKGSEPVPHLEGIFGVTVRRLVANHIEVSIANGRQDAIKDSLDVGTGAQGARECFRTALGVSCYGQTYFDGGGLTLSLTQKKIAVSPRDLGGKRIDLFAAQQSVSRSRRIAFGFAHERNI